jgi:hypothetical protein
MSNLAKREIKFDRILIEMPTHTDNLYRVTKKDYLGREVHIVDGLTWDEMIGEIAASTVSPERAEKRRCFAPKEVL